MLPSLCSQIRIGRSSHNISKHIQSSLSLYRFLSSTDRGGTALHLRGLPNGLSENLAYSLFSTYGTLKEIVVYDEQDGYYNNNNYDIHDAVVDGKKCAIVTFNESSSAFACRAEMNWRPLSLSPNSNTDKFVSECLLESAKHRNIVKIDFETELSQKSLPDWIQNERIASRELLPLYQQIKQIEQAIYRSQQQHKNPDGCSDLEEYETKRLELETELKNSKEKIFSSIKEY